MRVATNIAFKRWQPLPVVTPEAIELAEGRGARWVSGAALCRVGLGTPTPPESGVSPGPRQPPHAKPPARIGGTRKRAGATNFEQP